MDGVIVVYNISLGGDMYGFTLAWVERHLPFMLPDLKAVKVLL